MKVYGGVNDNTKWIKVALRYTVKWSDTLWNLNKISNKYFVKNFLNGMNMGQYNS
jgi:hypothetical protein